MEDLQPLKKKFCKCYFINKLKDLTRILFVNNRDVTAPKRISSDNSCTTEWLDGLNSLISLSKIAARVIKFNYCPPPPFKIPGPVKVSEKKNQIKRCHY